MCSPRPARPGRPASSGAAAAAGACQSAPRRGAPHGEPDHPRPRPRPRPGPRLQHLQHLAVLLALLLGCLGCATCVRGASAPMSGQDEDLAALGTLDTLLAYEDFQRAVQQAEQAMPEDADDVWGRLGPGTAGSVGKVPWQPAQPDPQLYLLTELDRNSQTRVKRNRDSGSGPGGQGHASSKPARPTRRMIRNPPGTSPQRLSIVNPLDVLRQRILLEIARRRQDVGVGLATPQTNRNLLENVGKRSGPGAGAGGLGGGGRAGAGAVSAADQMIDRCLYVLGERYPWVPRDEKMRLSVALKLVVDGKCELDSEEEAGRRLGERRVDGDRTERTASMTSLSSAHLPSQQRQPHEREQYQTGVGLSSGAGAATAEGLSISVGEQREQLQRERERERERNERDHLQVLAMQGTGDVRGSRDRDRERDALALGQSASWKRLGLSSGW